MVSTVAVDVARASIGRILGQLPPCSWLAALSAAVLFAVSMRRLQLWDRHRNRQGLQRNEVSDSYLYEALVGTVISLLLAGLSLAQAWLRYRDSLATDPADFVGPHPGKGLFFMVGLVGLALAYGVLYTFVKPSRTVSLMVGTNIIALAIVTVDMLAMHNIIDSGGWPFFNVVAWVVFLVVSAFTATDASRTKLQFHQIKPTATVGPSGQPAATDG